MPVPTGPLEESVDGIIEWVTEATIWDGQSVLPGGPLPGSTQECSVSPNQVLFVMLTPTITDPAPNRVHQSGSLPFDPDTIRNQHVTKRDDG